MLKVIGAGLLVCGLASGAHAASPFDGVYHGSNTSNGNGNYRCDPGREFTIRVVDGKFNYGGGGESERVSVPVAADGSFSAQAGQRYLSGKIQGSSMTATTSGSRCNYTWNLSK